MRPEARLLDVKLIDRLKEKGLTGKTRIIVGGAPVSAVERISQLAGGGA